MDSRLFSVTSLRWALVGQPAGSTAARSDPTAVMPTFAVDRSGTSVAQLIVNDGFVNSVAGTLTISTQNSPPVANTMANRTTHLGTRITVRATFCDETALGAA